MFITMRSFDTHTNQVSRSKVKVTLEVIEKLLCKTFTCKEGFQYNLAQMFTIMRRVLRAKFGSLWSRSHIGVKVEIKI
jgi:hypothetical protein